MPAAAGRTHAGRVGSGRSERHSSDESEGGVVGRETPNVRPGSSLGVCPRFGGSVASSMASTGIGEPECTPVVLYGRSHLRGDSVAGGVRKTIRQLADRPDGASDEMQPRLSGHYVACQDGDDTRGAARSDDAVKVNDGGRAGGR